jgi:hypothetical protein
MKKIVVFCFLLILSGCGYNKWAAPIISFSATAPSELSTIKTLYTTVNTNHIQSQKYDLIFSYNKNGYYPGKINNFISDNDLQVRFNAITSLINYITIINEISSGKATSNFIPFAKITTSNILTIKGNNTRAISMDPIIGGLNSVAYYAIEHKARKNLPRIMIAADPYVQQISSLLSNDITILQSQALLDSDNIVISQNQFIQTNISSFNKTDYKTQLDLLVQDDLNSTALQSSITSAIITIKNIANTHHQLVLQFKKE